MNISKKTKEYTMIARIFLFSIGLLLSCNIFARPPAPPFATTEELNAAINSIPLPPIYVIGDTGPAGGWVFYVDKDGLHGLEAAPADQHAGIPWYNGTYTYTEARGDGVGAGKMNTMLIIANQGYDSNSYAAGLCANLVIANAGVDYGDWYLPSINELFLMHTNLYKVGMGDFTSGNYWSSSEVEDNSRLEAWGKSFTTGFEGHAGKENALRVRAARTF